MRKFLAVLMSLVVILGIASPSMGKAEEGTTKFTVVFKDSSISGNATKTIKDLGGTIVYEVPEIGLVQVEAPAGFAKNAINNKSIVAANPSFAYDLPNTKSIELESNEDLTEQAGLFDTYQWDIKRLTNDGATFAEGAEGGAQSAWIMKAIISAANDGVDVINMSLGGIYSKAQVYYNDPETGEKVRLGSDIAEYVAYMRAAKYAESKGSLIVSSAGNDAIDAKSPKTVTELANEKYGELGYEFQGASVYAPADIPNVVTVSATGPQDELAVYSTYGNGYVDVAAPGGNYDLRLEYIAAGKDDEYLANQLYIHEFAFSSVPYITPITNENGNVIDYQYDGPGYSWMVGTSMASPKVSAIAALLYDEHEGASPSDIKVMLKQTAEDIGAGST